ncbi:MAG: c(7)-type cytochrome triheme domain-containing protein [Thermodesulfobacteriota bacterium]
MTGRHSIINKVFLSILFISLIVILTNGKITFASQESDQVEIEVEEKADIEVKVEEKVDIEVKIEEEVDIEDEIDLVDLYNEFEMEDRFITIGNPDNLASRAARIGAKIHPEALEIEGLKKDRFGLIDWAQIIRDGKIAPKISVDPTVDSNRFEDWVMLFENIAGFDVLFPHDVHTYWLDCKSCHDRIFKAKYRANPIRMKDIIEGKWCGWCHGKIAFPIEECPRCHLKITAEE